MCILGNLCVLLFVFIKADVARGLRYGAESFGRERWNPTPVTRPTYCDASWLVAPVRRSGYSTPKSLRVWKYHFKSKPGLSPSPKFGTIHRYRTTSMISTNFIQTNSALSVLVKPHKPLYPVVNSLWPSGVTWRHRTGSTLARVMACCLTAPSHYLNQCWLIISKAQYHSSEGNSIKDTPAMKHEKIAWKLLIKKCHLNLPGAIELK